MNEYRPDEILHFNLAVSDAEEMKTELTRRREGGDGLGTPRDASARLAAARAAVRRLPVQPLGTRAFIAEKRRAAKRER